jgi:hypothetical protein
MREYRFTVEGKGSFPFDMLRYDSCWPIAPEDAMQMEEPDTRQRFGELRRVELAHRADHGGWRATDGRWASFMWNVVEEARER